MSETVCAVHESEVCNVTAWQGKKCEEVGVLIKVSVQIVVVVYSTVINNCFNIS